MIYKHSNIQKNGTDPSSLVFISHRLLLIYSRVEATKKPKWPQKHCLCSAPRTTSGVFESTLLYFAYSNKYWVSIEMRRRWIPTDIQTAACGDKPSACTSCFITFPLQQHAHTHTLSLLCFPGLRAVTLPASHPSHITFLMPKRHKNKSLTTTVSTHGYSKKH